ncbi:hypothetical protein LZZ85_18555 [Terrimonas sp. NA20]|uniref:Uncharacterized protein n=1 Tax=Terrimonas ginsenosidimutans TaxID=2908004 RepID=A0ABS9KVJ6_9BACT|nr:hypothetical protein [Terrimonas ginsenosidimutans]MCG2616307.1 hypothetical protein [Terrimonas ginsenosidimutans]
MKTTIQINNLNDLEKELARLHQQLSAKETAITQHWVGLKRNALKLCWNSFRAGFASSMLKSVLGGEADHPVTIALRDGIKWIAARFKKQGG